MRYISTRDGKTAVTASEAISLGLARDGGLFTPETIPQISLDFISELCTLPYSELASKVIKLYLDEFSAEELSAFTKSAYDSGGYDEAGAAPVRSVCSDLSFLELWHGPTCAFKDMALQMLPHLLTASLKKIGETRQVCILAATSGDTGKAALEGFKDVPGTCILVFYPRDGVSEIQKLQMTTQEGENVGVCAVEGNFDDAQSGVKAIFSDEALHEILDLNGKFLSSANSINWGRLLPQIAYYISSYCDLVKSGSVSLGEKVNFCVPTGNFGNILAGYLAYKMGLPVNKLICASNINNVLTDFLKTGVYDRKRTLYPSISPSMDILISSNLERLLFYVSGMDDKLIYEYMSSLDREGRYAAKQEIMEEISAVFECGYCDDNKTKRAIKDLFDNYNYLADTHTAVAYNVYSAYRSKSRDKTKTVIVSTASPYKFCENVLDALGRNPGFSGLELLGKLSGLSGTPVPRSLAELKDKKNRFGQCVSRKEMRSAVLVNFGIKR